MYQRVSRRRQRMDVVDVAIVGGGAVGAACARSAAARGLHVAIFEPGPDPAAASPASAGMLAAQIEPTDDALVGLSVRARDLYEPLAPALRETTGIDIGFWRAGIAAVAFDDAAADRLKEDVARQRQAGLRCDWLEADEVRERWPGAAPDCRGALFAPEDGALDPQGLTRACLADARVLGTTMEHAGFDCRVTNEGLAQIFRGAVRLLPALLNHGVQRMWAGLRPVTGDGRPIVGPDPDVERLWYAAGHGRNGILLAALTGEIIADLVTKGETDVDISALSVNRLKPQAGS